MADGTPIEWTDATWQIVTGCSVVSPGCTNCYAMRLAGTRMKNHPTRKGLTIDSKAGPVWNGQVRFNAELLTQPLQWRRPRRIFVAAHGDLFHEGVTDGQLDQIFAVMALSPQHTFQVLTKRPERMRTYLASIWSGDASARWLETKIDRHGQERQLIDLIDVGYLIAPLSNLWLGVSVEDQARADERVPILLETPAAVRWISAEPLLGPIDLTSLPFPKACDCDNDGPALNALDASVYCPGCCEGPEPTTSATIDWVVAGGESGPGSRPMHPDWARRLRDQCADAGVAFLFKQWGDHVVPYDGDRACRVCGCTENWACGDQAFGACAWAEPDLCTSCIGRPTPAERAVRFHRAGKKLAGRLLDGRLHDDFPATSDRPGR